MNKEIVDSDSIKEFLGDILKQVKKALASVKDENCLFEYHSYAEKVFDIAIEIELTATELRSYIGDQTHELYNDEEYKTPHQWYI